MTMTVTIPEDLAAKVVRRATRQGTAPEQLVVDLLEADFDSGGVATPEEVVAKIKATPPDPAAFVLAQESLIEFLRDALDEPPIDSDAWNQEWAVIEAEMKHRDHLDDIAEGRG